MIIDTKKIEKALFTGKAPEVSKKFNIPAQSIRQYRANSDSGSYRDWKKMSLEKAEEMMEIIIEEEKEMYEELKNFIESDIAEKGLGHGNIEDFDTDKLLNGEVIKIKSDDFGPKHECVEVILSLDPIELDNVIDNYTTDFGEKEIEVYYIKA